MEEKYTKLLSTFERIILNTKNEELKTSAKKSYATFIYYLAVLEKKDLNIYEEMMQSLNIPEDAIKNTLDNIKVSLKKTNSNEFEQESEILKENDEVIESEPIEETVKEKEVETSNNKTVEEYILTNVHGNKNQNIGEEHRKLVSKLIEDLKNSNDKLIKTWVNNYMSFIEKYKNELEKDQLIEYMYILFKQYDKENKYIDKLPEFIKEFENGTIEKNDKIEEPEKDNETKKEEQKKETEPLKILNVKKSFKSKKELAVLGTTALVGGLVFGTSGMLVLPIAAIIYKLYKNKKVTNSKLKKFLKDNNYRIDEETQELKDNNGEVITDEKINKSKYEMIKQYLLKQNTKKQDGDIKTEYKKNKMASKLLNTKFVEKLKNITKRNELEEPKEVEELEENQEIQKGMGLC